MISYAAYPASSVREDKLGLCVTSGRVTISKSQKNLIGLSISGGHPFCPCLYIVQIFDNSSAAQDGTLEAGDEIVAVNSRTVKGLTKSQAARLIVQSTKEVTLYYNKLHVDMRMGKTGDHLLTKLKHRFAEKISAETADGLGISRALLVNDPMVLRLKALHQLASFYQEFLYHMKQLLRRYIRCSIMQKRMGDTFAEVGAREPNKRATEAFTLFGDVHRQMFYNTEMLVKQFKPLISNLITFVKKIIPDMNMTVKKYLNSKFDYLTFCLKVKEMADEEEFSNITSFPLYRVSSGNYKFRVVLRCRQMAKHRFAKRRHDVLEKLELLDSNRFRTTIEQLQAFTVAIDVDAAKNYIQAMRLNNTFPVEIDLSEINFKYDANETYEFSSTDDELID